MEWEADFGRLLLPVARRWRAEADRAVATLGLSHASGWALLHVGRLGSGEAGVRQGDLAAAIDMRGSSLVPLLDRLEQAGLVARETEDGDRRVNRIHLSAQGRALVDRLETALRAIRRELLDGVEEADLTAAVRVMGALERRMSARRGADQ